VTTAFIRKTQGLLIVSFWLLVQLPSNKQKHLFDQAYTKMKKGLRIMAEKEGKPNIESWILAQN
jgi:hypothetical protein